MSSDDALASIADSSAFVFIADVAGSEARTGDRSMTVIVRAVLKAPAGLSGLDGREVTIQLDQALAPRRYVFFTDLVAAGSTLVVRETAHLDAELRDDAEAAVEQGYVARLRPRLEAAWLVALGTVGEVTPVFSPAEQAGRVPWALASFDIERALKGSRSRRHLTLIGPASASKRLPRSPALQAGLYAVFLLQRPPDEAMEHIASGDRQAAGFIAETADIQPPERAEQIARILGSTRRRG
jgi:hypothetical protein